ncbi:putative NT-type C2 domain-containing protein [Helianthus anomalus]
MTSTVKKLVNNLISNHVPKVWDKLSVSIISVETGKTIARTNKALVRNGNCQWTETLSESIWIKHNNSPKELEEHLFKFVVSMGSARCGILGEAMVNMARYYTSSRSSSPVSLPLKKCSYGTVLQVIRMFRMEY